MFSLLILKIGTRYLYHEQGYLYPELLMNCNFYRFLKVLFSPFLIQI